jgi:hypothetical protein
LGARGGQNLKLQDIKSILDSLKPADLINLANLDAAIAKMMELLKLQGTKTLVPTTTTTTTPSSVASAITAIDKIISARGDNANASLGFSTTSTLGNDGDKGISAADQAAADAAAYFANAITAIDSIISGRDGNSNSSLGFGNPISITVNTGVGDPNAIAEAIDQVLADAVSRGTLRSERFQ